MKDIYKRIENLSNELDTMLGEIREDGKSIIIGMADNNTEVVETLCVIGFEKGILEMVGRLAEIFSGLPYDDFDEDATELN